MKMSKISTKIHVYAYAHCVCSIVYNRLFSYDKQYWYFQVWLKSVPGTKCFFQTYQKLCKLYFIIISVLFRCVLYSNSLFINSKKKVPFVPGLPPNTHISPEFSFLRPTMQDNSVVFPHPEAPKRPYLKHKNIKGRRRKDQIKLNRNNNKRCSNNARKGTRTKEKLKPCARNHKRTLQLSRHSFYINFE